MWSFVQSPTLALSYSLRSLLCLACIAFFSVGHVYADSRGQDLAQWLNERGVEYWGASPELCDDLTFARRIFLDLLGRLPSVAELRDFEDLPANRRERLVDEIVFGEGNRAKVYSRLASQQLARQWRKVLLPTGTTTAGPTEGIERWLASEFEQRVSYDELMKKLVRFDSTSAAPQYFQAAGSLPENYAGHISRALLGVRIECAQCHDHPFSKWKQEDFWGLAAFYGDMSGQAANPDQSTRLEPIGRINFEGKQYVAKVLWSAQPAEQPPQKLREALGDWLTSAENPQFAATAVNRFWQQLVGRGLVPDVENLDQATGQEREFLGEFGQRFAEMDFQIEPLIAAICKSNWYQATSRAEPVDSGFYRPLKSVSPEQVFDSMEQSLLLPISRVDSATPRFSGDRAQLISRLNEAVGSSPEDYVAGIPQALLMMNGKMTSEAIDPVKSRLLRAVVDSPFFDSQDQIEVLYMAVLTRRPTAAEAAALDDFVDSQSHDRRGPAMGEILWALLNSPEFVLCR